MTASLPKHTDKHPNRNPQVSSKNQLQKPVICQQYQLLQQLNTTKTTPSLHQLLHPQIQLSSSVQPVEQQLLSSVLVQRQLQALACPQRQLLRPHRQLSQPITAAACRPEASTQQRACFPTPVEQEEQQEWHHQLLPQRQLWQQRPRQLRNSRRIPPHQLPLGSAAGRSRFNSRPQPPRRWSWPRHQRQLIQIRHL